MKNEPLSENHSVVQLMAALSFHILLFLLLASLSSITIADPRADILWRACSDSPVPKIAPYRQTFYKLSSDMEDAMRRNKSAYAEGLISVGNSSSTDDVDVVFDDDVEKVYVFAQCIEDLSDEDCSVCFRQLRTLLPGCFPSSGGRVYLDGCYIRVDDYYFFNDSKVLDNFMRCGDTKFDNEELVGDVKEMLAGLKTNAPDNNGYAALQESAGTPGVYGMANCWRNVNSSSCALCLEDAYESALKCLPSSEGRIANTGCFMHYSDYKFANEVIAETKKGFLLSIA